MNYSLPDPARFPVTWGSTLRLKEGKGMHEDRGNHSLEMELTRREFVATTFSAGFALAAAPVSAQTITADTSGLVSGDVKIPAADGEIPSYRSRPASGGPFPIALVVCEVFGLQEHIKDICRRFANEGYLAVAPDFFFRQGDVSKIEKMDDVFKIVSQTPDIQVLSDLDAAVEWAAKNQGNAGKMGVTGFCWGGRVTWLYASHNPKVKAGAAWYGRLVGDATPLQPKHAIDIVPSLKVPVLGLYGGQDQGIPLDTVERMRDALKKAGNPSEIIVYPDAGHGFFADVRPSYRKEDAADAWKRLLAWFRKHGAA
jgi:carboxymethylenebutenolidase